MRPNIENSSVSQYVARPRDSDWAHFDKILRMAEPQVKLAQATLSLSEFDAGYESKPSDREVIAQLNPDQVRSLLDLLEANAGYVRPPSGVPFTAQAYRQKILVRVRPLITEIVMFRAIERSAPTSPLDNVAPAPRARRLGI